MDKLRGFNIVEVRCVEGCIGAIVMCGGVYGQMHKIGHFNIGGIYVCDQGYVFID